jgi:hypothetical protein
VVELGRSGGVDGERDEGGEEGGLTLTSASHTQSSGLLVCSKFVGGNFLQNCSARDL